MIANDEPNSLIDWIGPVVNGANNKPLIPLPSFDNQVQFSEDNPFDAVERQVNENDPFYDVFNLNLSLENEADSPNNSKNGSVLNDSISQEIEVINLNDVWEKKNTSSTNDFGCDEIDQIVDGSCSAAKVESESDKSQFETSAVSSLSNISDFKEMVINRISNCINKALHQSGDVDFFLKRMTPESISPVLENTNSHSRPPSIMNDCLILSEIEESSKLENRMDADFLKGFDDDGEDIQSIVPTWDEALLSSSDEENEKQSIGSHSEKSRVFNSQKKSAVSQIDKAKGARIPLVFQDPNIRIKKNNVTSKQGPLKAMMPISNMKKVEGRGTALTSSDNKTTSTKKLKTAPPSTQYKQKRWSSPVATSTPQSLKLVQSNSQKLSILKKSTPDVYSRPSSPDSTSGSRINSRISITKLTSKSCIRKLASNAVSSSTNITFPRLVSKTSKDCKNTSVNETVSNSLVGAKSSLKKNCNNKENILPFRYK